jgi:hypothetical protein
LASPIFFNQRRIVPVSPRAVHALRYRPFLQHIFRSGLHKSCSVFHVATLLGALPSPLWKGKIEQIADDLLENQYLHLAVRHAALCLHMAEAREDLPSGKPDLEKRDALPSESVAGLKRASSDIKIAIDELVQKTHWREFGHAKRYAEYSTLRRIVLDQYRTPGTEEDRHAYYQFLAILLLYITARAEADATIRRRQAYRAIRLFHVAEYLDELVFPPSIPATEFAKYEFPRPSVKVSDLIDVLKEEFNIDNPLDPSIGSFFNVSASTSASFVCYRYTSRNRAKRNDNNQITKSYLQIDPPRGDKKVFSFKHRYINTDGTFRITSGFVVRLQQAFYMIGGSLRQRGQSAVGVKVIAIPTAESGTWYEHDFISGLFLSNDSALNPISGRLLLMRIGECDEAVQDQHCGRISEDEFFTDLKANATSSARLKKSDKNEFLKAMKNVGKVMNIDTTITSYVKKA